VAESKLRTVESVAVIPSRRTFWLSGAALLVAIVACEWFFMPRSRITRENYDRIEEGYRSR
jgi:hypothetical protein